MYKFLIYFLSYLLMEDWEEECDQAENKKETVKKKEDDGWEAECEKDSPEDEGNKKEEVKKLDPNLEESDVVYKKEIIINKEPKEEGEKISEWEEKYRKKEEAKIKRREEQEQALANLTEQEKKEKLEKLAILNDQDDINDIFQAVKKSKEESKENEKEPFLKTEKDFIDFATKVAAKLNIKKEIVVKGKFKKGKEVKKMENIYSGKSIYEFLKKTLESLMEHLNSTQLTDIKDNLTKSFNKKLNEEKDTSKKAAKSKISGGKAERKSNIGFSKDEDLYDDNEDYDDYNY